MGIAFTRPLPASYHAVTANVGRIIVGPGVGLAPGDGLKVGLGVGVLVGLGVNVIGAGVLVGSRAIAVGDGR